MDEWLSVGDAAFVSKAEDRLEHLITQSRILVFASHMRTQIERVCNRAVLLEHGRLVAEGSVANIFDLYERTNAPAARSEPGAEGETAADRAGVPPSSGTR